METLKSKDVDWKKIAVVAALVALTALVASVLVWYYQGQEVLTQAEYYEEQLREKAIEAISSDADEGGACDAAATTTSECETAVAYTPGGLFTDSEKNEIKTKIVDPYIYYENNVATDSSRGRLASVHVQKYGEDEREDYWYGIDAIFENGGNSGWLSGENGTISYWKPECMGVCTLTQAYVDKYPNNLPTDYEVK